MNALRKFGGGNDDYRISYHGDEFSLEKTPYENYITLSINGNTYELTKDEAWTLADALRAESAKLIGRES